MNRPPLRLVLVEWVDSHSGRGWQDIESLNEAAEPLYCRSVGWVLKKTGQSLVLVPHITGDKNGREMYQGTGELVIPNRAIIELRALR